MPTRWQRSRSRRTTCRLAGFGACSPTSLEVKIAFTSDGQGERSAALSIPMQDVANEDAAWRLPFEGVWWGGEDALRNHHISVPSQRYAYDLVVRKDGAIWQGTGARNEDCWVWTRQVLASTAGEVVAVITDETDRPLTASLFERNRSLDPGGNHVVLKTVVAEWVMLAHLQQGTVRVRAGERVGAGDSIGLVGNAGNSSEPHLHILRASRTCLTTRRTASPCDSMAFSSTVSRSTMLCRSRGTLSPPLSDPESDS
jgi:hypothetical protein